MSRLLEINTPLGAENTVLTHMSGREELGRLPAYQLTLVSRRGKLGAADLLGKNITVGLELPGGQALRYFNGYVTQFSEDGAAEATCFEDGGDGLAHQYRLTMHPWLWFLSRSSNFRMFQNKTVVQVVKEVCDAYPFAELKLMLSATYQPREYQCQYRETDFNFVLRLLEQEGIYFSFQHQNGKHTMLLFDSHGSHAPRAGYERIVYSDNGNGDSDSDDSDPITDWRTSREVQSGSFSLTDFDFKKPKISLLSTSSKPLQHDLDGFAQFDYPGEHETHEAGTSYARIRLEEMHARHEMIAASGLTRGIEPGCTFKLAQHPNSEANRDYLVTGASYSIHNNEPASGGGGGGDFHCSFQAIDSRTQFRAQRLTPRPAIAGPQTAMVVGPAGEEIHVDKHGRVKLQFQWDRYNKADENSSCWVRVSHPWSSKGWGALFLPRIGHEVIVQFLDGDPDRPIVVGRVNNGDAAPPWALPNEKTRSGIRTRTYKGGAANFNELSFDDKQGAEELFMQAERDQVVRIKHDRIEDIGNESHVTVHKDSFREVKGDVHEKVTGDQNSSADGSVSLKVGQDWQTKAGAKIAADAGTEIHLKAGMKVVIEAGASLSLKVGGNFISINPGGVFIKGTMVMINSGGDGGSGAGASPIAPRPPKAPRASKGGTDFVPVRPTPPQAYSPQAAALKLAWHGGEMYCERCEAAKAKS